MTGLKDSQGYMIYEMYKVTDKHKKSEEIVERSLLYSEVLCNSLSKSEEFKNYYADKQNVTVEFYFLVKRKLFLDSTIDRAEYSLLFHQVFLFPILLRFSKKIFILYPNLVEHICHSWRIIGQRN